jgi:alkylation response protein AidB-like acyl-CoA dehydrogenase
MDDFLTPNELTIRRKVRVRLREPFRPGRGTAAEAQAPNGGPAGLEGLRRELGLPSPGTGGGSGSVRGLLERALVIEEVAAASPKLGRALLEAAPAPPGIEGAAGELAWAIGSAAAALEAGLAAARERGLFESTLMGHQKVQGDLAEAFSAVQALRLKAYRALRLVDRGERVRGEHELGRAAAEAAAVRGRALALAGALLGPGRLADMMPEEERSGR